MPFETPEAAAARKVAKAQRARELADQKRLLELAVQERVLAALSVQFIRGYDELGALLRVSSRQAFSIASRPDFPRPRSISEGVRLWATRQVVEWVEQRPVDGKEGQPTSAQVVRKHGVAA